MIAYFPTAYPDELLYSQIARYYAKSGYMAYTFAAEELFASKTVRPDMDFINAYTPGALQAITRNMPMEAVVEKHTMFPCYGRFLPKEYSGTLVKTKIDKFLNVSGSRHCSIEQQCREVALCWRDVPDG